MKLLLTTLLLVASSGIATASSTQLGRALSLGSCGESYARSEIKLSKARNGDLAIQLTGVDKKSCNKLRFYDYSSGKTIKTYTINGTSYTLSKSQNKALSSDCKVGIQVYGNSRYSGDEGYSISLPWWCNSRSDNSNSSKKRYRNNQSNNYTGWAWSSKGGTCRYYENGRNHHDAKYSQEWKCGGKAKKQKKSSSRAKYRNNMSNNYTGWAWSSKGGTCRYYENGKKHHNAKSSQEWKCNG